MHCCINTLAYVHAISWKRTNLSIGNLTTKICYFSMFGTIIFTFCSVHIQFHNDLFPSLACDATSFFLRMEAAHCMWTFVPYETLAVHRQWMYVCVCVRRFSFEIHPFGTMGTSMPWPCSFLLSLAKRSLIYFYSILFGKFVSCAPFVYRRKIRQLLLLLIPSSSSSSSSFSILLAVLCVRFLFTPGLFFLLFATFRSVHKKIVVQLCNQHAREPYTQQLIAVWKKRISNAKRLREYTLCWHTDTHSPREERERKT